MVFEHLVAGLAQLRAILLEASQNGEVALIDHGTAEALDIARTGRLLFRGAAASLLLGHRGGGNGDRQQGESEKEQIPRANGALRNDNFLD